jgi:hypothetical protein
MQFDRVSIDEIARVSKSLPLRSLLDKRQHPFDILGIEERRFAAGLAPERDQWSAPWR